MPTFPSPSQLFASYQTALKGKKPDFNPNDALSDFNIRGQVVTGLLSGVYGDQKKVDDDTFVRDAREESAERTGADLGIPRSPATAAVTGAARATGTPGSSIQAGTSLTYLPTGAVYETVSAATIGAGGSVLLSVRATVPGQQGNVQAPDTLAFQASPTGVDATVTLEEALAGGTELETLEAYKSRLLSRLQNAPAGGNANDYANWAFEADPSVRGRSVQRFGRGLGTVDVYITSGTTDVDAAVTAGTSVVRIPSSQTLATVQAYYDEKAPLTDCPRVFAPTEKPIDVTVKVIPIPGKSLNSIPADAANNPQGLSVADLVRREVARVLYKYQIGGRMLPGQGDLGYVVASDIEKNLDTWLSGVPDVNGLTDGIIPVLLDWQVQPLSNTSVNRTLLGNELPAPGVITVALGA